MKNGPEAFRWFLQQISGHFDNDNHRDTLINLHAFAVEEKTPFSDYHRAFCVWYLVLLKVVGFSPQRGSGA